jgi:DNA-binding FrmR family transcriptional regulator
MVKDEQPCNQILCKIGLIRQALRSLRRSLIAHKIQDSILVIQNHPDSEIQLLELSRLQDFYREMIQDP